MAVILAVSAAVLVALLVALLVAILPMFAGSRRPDAPHHAHGGGEPRMQALPTMPIFLIATTTVHWPAGRRGVRGGRRDVRLQAPARRRALGLADRTTPQRPRS